MNKNAQALGRMAKGKPKTISGAERKRRAKRLATARTFRWTEALRSPTRVKWDRLHRELKNETKRKMKK